MDLIAIYKCLCDQTRLRLVHLLTQGPLCVCHLQSILGAPQVAVSKHLAYLRERGVVESQRHEQWMIYRLPNKPQPELEMQLRCLQDCVQTHLVFREDLKKLKKIRSDCDWLEDVVATQRTARK